MTEPTGPLDPDLRDFLAGVAERRVAIKDYDSRPEVLGEVRARQRELDKIRRQRPEVRARKREYSQRPEVRARQREYSQRPEVRARKRELDKIRRQRPEVRARKRDVLTGVS